MDSLKKSRGERAGPGQFNIRELVSERRFTCGLVFYTLGSRVDRAPARPTDRPACAWISIVKKIHVRELVAQPGVFAAPPGVSLGGL
jgi:hypothetical protein